MKYESFLIKYSEIGTKGNNRYIFEDALMHQIREHLKRVDGEFAIQKEQGRIYVNAQSDYDYDEAVDAISHVFGVTGICPMKQFPVCAYDELRRQVLEFVKTEHPEKSFSFKVHCRRADKSYPKTSDEINADVGYDILTAYPESRVDVHDPDFIVYIEIRKQVNVFTRVLPGAGGMPTGTNGKAMLLCVAKADFKRILSTHTEFYEAMLWLAARRIRQLYGLVEDLNTLPLRARLAKQLLHLARSYGIPSLANGEEIRIGLQLAQEELAQLLGASRQRVNQELKGMEREAIIRIEPGGLVVRDRDALLRIVETDL